MSQTNRSSDGDVPLPSEVAPGASTASPMSTITQPTTPSTAARPQRRSRQPPAHLQEYETEISRTPSPEEEERQMEEAHMLAAIDLGTESDDEGEEVDGVD